MFPIKISKTIHSMLSVPTANLVKIKSHNTAFDSRLDKRELLPDTLNPGMFEVSGYRLEMLEPNYPVKIGPTTEVVFEESEDTIKFKQQVRQNFSFGFGRAK